MFTKEELTVILDGLASLPLARSYNVFQKGLQILKSMEDDTPNLQSLPTQPVNGEDHALRSQ